MSSSEWAYVVERVVTPVGASSGRASSISRVVAKEAANGRVLEDEEGASSGRDDAGRVRELARGGGAV